MTQTNDRFRLVHDHIAAGWGDPPHFLALDLPDWYGYALGDVALILGEDDTIVYTDATASGGADDPHTATIAVFTTSLLIHISAEAPEGAATRTTTVVPRSALSQLQLHTGTSAMDNRIDARWPGHVRLKLDYEGGLSINLPLGRHVNRGHSDRLAEFVPALRNDLLT